MLSRRFRIVVLAPLSSLLVSSALVGCGEDADVDEATRDTAGEVVEGGEIGALEVRVGDCLGAEVIGEVTSVPVVPCSEPHDTEIYHSFDLAGTEFPGEDAVAEQAALGCIEEFEAFIGIAFGSSVWDIGTIRPTQLAWDEAADRTVFCTVYPLDETDTSGSARGIAE